jgi:arsenical pump membrane protein
MPPLVTWLGALLMPSLASILVTFFALRFVSRMGLEGEISETLTQTQLSVEGRLALGGLIMAAIVLVTASALGWPLGAPTCVAAVLATCVVAWRDRGVPLQIAKGISWPVLPLVAGLFVIVEALQSAGALRLALAGLHAAANLSGSLGNLVVAFAVGLLSNGMNNLPVGLLSGTALQTSHEPSNLANAVLIGVDLGPNLSITGSLATLLWLIALRRENVKVTGWQFFKVGLVVMPTALLASILALHL